MSNRLGEMVHAYKAGKLDKYIELRFGGYDRYLRCILARLSKIFASYNSRLKEVLMFSFREHAVGHQSKEQTLLILTYELGKLIEYNHKATIYGESNYYCDANQQKEMADMISMARYYCEMKGWDFDVLMKLGEEAYLDRMEDISKYGINRDSS